MLFSAMTLVWLWMLLPVLRIFGDMPWFVHAVLIIGTASKLQLVLHLATCAKPGRGSELAG